MPASKLAARREAANILNTNRLTAAGQTASKLTTRTLTAARLTASRQAISKLIATRLAASRLLQAGLWATAAGPTDWHAGESSGLRRDLPVRLYRLTVRSAKGQP